MSPEITMIVLLAAIFNASWNAIVKVSGDRIAVMAVMTLLGSLVSALALPFVMLPDPASWPLLGLAILIHTAYHFCLPMAYQHGDFGQVYPIARGSAPLLVTLGAAAFAGEMLGFLPLLGVLFLGVGVMSLSFDTSTGITRNPHAILLALGTGALIASYTLVGGLGARQAGSVLGFAVLLTLGNGLLTFAIALAWKAKEIKKVISSNLAPAIAGGGMQVGAYWIVIWAMAYAPLGMVSALRETSVLFAALISTIILKEGFGVWRFVSSGLIACGIALTRYKP
ncbi:MULTISPECIES: EamA family transporter [unclassified Halomonas]|uniref:EamA family transporter n=1 Tax=unclassified Halomonas TaxID=2609666 RepID=UPI001BE6FF6E|nr:MULTISPECIES: EamA family transporter [unclassified Halomonas]MBT2786737.1 EamA family transporter [Halomonas sp. ISL-106]MBT2798611.1 EamA family transporter [Halomonas sp. ISL-104]